MVGGENLVFNKLNRSMLLQTEGVGGELGVWQMGKDLIYPYFGFPLSHLIYFLTTWLQEAQINYINLYLICLYRPYTC